MSVTAPWRVLLAQASPRPLPVDAWLFAATAALEGGADPVAVAHAAERVAWSAYQIARRPGHASSWYAVGEGLRLFGRGLILGAHFTTEDRP